MTPAARDVLLQTQARMADDAEVLFLDAWRASWKPSGTRAGLEAYRALADELGRDPVAAWRAGRREQVVPVIRRVLREAK